MTNHFKDGERLIFLIGSPRSGTTYLQKLISAHPNVQTGQESHLFDVIGPLIENWGNSYRVFEQNPEAGVGLPCYLEEERLFELVKKFTGKIISEMVGPCEKISYFLDKTPSHALQIPRIHRIFPKAKFLHIIRDVRDVTASLIAASKSWGASWAPNNPREAARMWNLFVSNARNSGETLPKGLYYEIKYEDLIADTIELMLNVSSFIGIQWKLDELKEIIQINDAENSKVNGGTKIELRGAAGKFNGDTVKWPEGFIRTAKAGGWRTELNLFDKYWVWRESRNTMEKFGYHWKFV